VKNPELPTLGPLPMDRILNFSNRKSWGISDPERFFQLMEEAKSLVVDGYYLSDNLFTWGRNNSTFEDEPFRKAWESNLRSDADMATAWRRYILATAGYHCVQLDGDFVECGVYQGSGIKTVMDYLGGTDFPKTAWAYDTFDYHPVAGHTFSRQKEGFYEEVCAVFQAYPQVRLIKGLLPGSFAQGCPDRIAWLHIDLNNADGELSVLEQLFHRVVPGGMIILDDYEWAGNYREQKRREDPWFDARGYRVMPLPTGQGMIIKRG
jgi:O-methyltransferase